MIKLDLYVKEIFDFLTTCSVKNVFIEEKMRMNYEFDYGLSSIPVWANPYYLHLIGHLSENDQEIMITSIDDGSEIRFNRYELELHTKTYNKYISSNVELVELMSEYPDMMDYIRGTIYPAETIADGVSTPTIIPQVTSEDGLTTVDLTHYKMVLNRDILKRYQTGYVDNQNYKDLTFGMSDSEIEYVNSILWPVREDDYIVTSPNLTLFNFNTNILHPNEQADMVAHLKKWLTMFDKRWAVGEFRYEEYYDGVRDSIMWQNMAAELLARRIVNIKTNSVHPYHIWEYLESHGLGDYRAILSSKQELFLYKNINYLVGNRGKLSNLKILSDNLLEGYGSEIRSKAVLQDTTDAALDCETTPYVISESLDTDITPLQNSEDGVETISEIVRREYSNKLEPEYNSEVIEAQTRILQNSKDTYLQTKLVEVVKKVEESDLKNLYFNFIAQSTVYKLAHGRCNFNINVRLSELESNVILTVGECIALLLYSNHMHVNHTVYNQNGITVVENDPLVQIPDHWFVFLPYREIPAALPQSIYASGVTSLRPIKLNTESLLLQADPNAHPPQNPLLAPDLSKFKRVIYDDVIPGLDDDMTDAYDLTANLQDQWFWLKYHYNTSRGCSDYTLGRAYRVAWEARTFEGLLEFDLVNGHTEYGEWLSGDSIFGPMFASWDLRTDADILYATLSNDIIKALYPGDTKLAEFTNDEYKLMIKLLTQLSSYNIAFLDKSAVEKEAQNLMQISQMWHDEYINESGRFDINQFECEHPQEVDEYGELNNVDINISLQSEVDSYGEYEVIEGEGEDSSDDYWERDWVPDLNIELISEAEYNQIIN